MDFSKLKNKLLILLCVFVVIFPFCCVAGLCSEDDIETLTPSTVSGISISDSRNYFASVSSGSVAYVHLEKGYKYIFLNSSEFNRYLAVSNQVPTVNGIYNFLTIVTPGSTYEYIPYDDTYLYIDWSASTGSISRVKLGSLDSAVSDLVDNVGINNIWGIFNNSIDYIYVVIIFAFGAYIIFRIIRKISKGKEGL